MFNKENNVKYREETEQKVGGWGEERISAKESLDSHYVEEDFIIMHNQCMIMNGDYVVIGMNPKWVLETNHWWFGPDSKHLKAMKLLSVF